MKTLNYVNLRRAAGRQERRMQDCLESRTSTASHTNSALSITLSSHHRPPHSTARRAVPTRRAPRAVGAPRRVDADAADDGGARPGYLGYRTRETS